MENSARERYAEFLKSGPLKRVYVDIPESAHTMLSDLAKENGLPMKAQLTLLIADAVEPQKPKRKRKTAKRKASKKRGKRRSKK